MSLKEAAEELDGFDEALTVDLGCPHQLTFAANGVSCIDDNVVILGFEHDGEVVKQVSSLGRVFTVVVKKV